MYQKDEVRTVYPDPRGRTSSFDREIHGEPQDFAPIEARPIDGGDAVLSIAGIVLVGIALRPSIICVGPVLQEIRAQFALAHWSASLLTSIPDLLMGLLALPSPWLAARFGRDRVIVGALAMLALATLGRSFAQNAVSLMLATVGVGAGIAIVGTLLSGFVKKRFAAKAAIMMGVYSTALSAGSAITAVSTAPVAANFGGWRPAVGVWSLFVGMGMAIWIAVARREADQIPASDGSPSHHALPWRNGLAWRIALYFAATNFIFYAMVAWTAAIFTEAGLSPGKAGFLLGAFTIAFTILSAVIGWLSKSIDRRAWLASGGAACTGGALALALAPNWAPFVSVSVIAGGLGVAFPLAMTLPLDNTSNAPATSAWTAFVLTLGYLVAATGPLAVGALRDLTGSFASSMFALVVAAALMLLASPFLKPQAKVS